METKPWTRLLLLLIMVCTTSVWACPSPCTCVYDVVRCTNQGLTSVPSTGFVVATTRHLYLDHNFLTNISAGDFVHLILLQSLDLQNNKLSQLPEGLLHGLSFLAHLYLNDNQLASLPSGLLSGLRSLIILDLQNNKLSQLPAGLLHGLSFLAYFHLQNNNVSQLPSGIFHGLSNLRTVRLNHNLLKSLEADTFKDLTQLRSLYLDNNMLESLPAGILASQTILDVLYLQYNSLKSLPDAIFNNTQQLAFLHLQDNMLQSLPTTVFGSLKKLQYLYLHNNKLEFLPPGLFDSQRLLTGLFLSLNRLKSLPVRIFSNLQNLKSLHLVANSTNVNSALCALVSLPPIQDLQMDVQLRQNISKASSATTCLTRSKLCYAQPSQAQHLFCECPQGQYYDGTHCANQKWTTQLATVVVDPTCQRYGGDYICQCPFGRKFTTKGCERDTVTFVNITDTTMSIAWQTNTYFFNGLQFENPEYTLQIRPLWVQSSGTISAKISPNEFTSLTLTGLINNMQYEISILGSDFQLSFAATTTPGAPELQSATSHNATSILLILRNSTVAQLDYNRATGFEIRYRTAESRSTQVIVIPNTITSTSMFTVTGLHPNTNYTFSVRAVTRSCTTPFSRSMSVTTKGAVPASSPVVTSLIAINSSKIQVSWNDLPEDQVNGKLLLTQINVTSATDDITLLNISNTDKSTLISGLQPFTNYLVSVRAVNGIGAGPLSPQLSVQTKATDLCSSPTVQPIRSTTSTSIQLTLYNPTLTPKSVLGINYEVRYRVAGSHGDQVVVVSASASTIVTVNGLRPHSNYTFVVRAVSSECIGLFGSQLSVTTTEDVPESSPVVTSLLAINSSTIQVSWNDLPEDQVNGKLLLIQVNVTSATDDITLLNISTIDKSTLISLLQPFTNYLVSLRAINGIGAGPLSPQLSVQTKATDLCSTPTVKPIRSAKSTSIQLTLQNPTLTPKPVLAINYEVRYRVGGTHRDQVVMVSASASTIVTVKGLRPHSNYTFAVRTVSSECIGVFGSQFSVTTNEEVPESSPVMTSLLAINSSTIQVSWKNMPEDLVNGKLLLIQVNVTSATDDITLLNISTTDKCTLISLLQPFTNYMVSLRAVNGIGAGPFSPQLSVQTKATVLCSTPTVQPICPSNSTSIQLTIQNPKLTPKPVLAINYEVRYRVAGSHGDQVVVVSASASTIVTVHGLRPHNNYTFVVRAVSSECIGLFGSQLSVTTNEEVPTGSPVLTSLLAINSSSIQVSWNEMPEDQMNGKLLLIQVNVTSATDDITLLNISTTDKSTLISGLQPFTNYMVSLRAVNGIGAGPFGPQLSVQTKATVSPPSSSSSSSSQTVVIVSAAAGLGALFLLLMVVIIATLVFRRRSHQSRPTPPVITGVRHTGGNSWMANELPSADNEHFDGETSLKAPFGIQFANERETALNQPAQTNMTDNNAYGMPDDTMYEAVN